MLEQIRLDKGWQLASSDALSVAGSVVSSLVCPPAPWTPVDLPSTVLAALVKAGEWPDPYVGGQFNELPGLGPASDNFSLHPMPEGSPFGVSWWYRKEFKIPDRLQGQALFLSFPGINYKANIWWNGVLVADASQICGTYRAYELEVSGLSFPGAMNVLAVEVIAPGPQDLANTWVDWNPAPPDKNMGLFREVRLVSSGPVALRNTRVVTSLDADGAARLRVVAEAFNTTASEQQCVVAGEVAARRFFKTVRLSPGERQRVVFEADAYPELVLSSPELWWPRTMGAQPLYDLTLELKVQGELSDSERVRFGVREVTCELTDDGHSLFSVNGRPIQIRGAGWASDMMLRWDAARERAELDYVVHLNLNTIRFEGPLMRDELLDWCDEEGILVIAGWCCCDHWEKWEKWGPEDPEIAAESLRSQIRRTRNHPSLISWWYGSDFSPPEAVERLYLKVLEEEDWPNPSHSSAADKPTSVTGSSGMKMAGPYEYVPPRYWAEDLERGGAHGFATEIGPGAAVPPIESLKEMFPADKLWPINEMWDLHSGCKEFGNVEIFTQALSARYGEALSVSEYAKKAQLVTYEAQRAMFEGYRAAQFRATGVIQWMLNNAWPSLIWHLYDYYLRPGGGFFGTRKALEPLHIQYCYVDNAVFVCSDLPETQRGLVAEAETFDLDLRRMHASTALIDAAPGTTAQVLKLPPAKDSRSDVYFLRLRLLDGVGTAVSDNFYWLSRQADVLAHELGNWYTTPMAETADFRALSELPEVSVEGQWWRDDTPQGKQVRAMVQNSGQHLAFFVRVRLVVQGTGQEVLPACWSDGYVSLLPGESKELAVEFPRGLAPGGEVSVQVDGFNVKAVELTPTVERAATLRSFSAASGVSEGAEQVAE